MSHPAPLDEAQFDAALPALLAQPVLWSQLARPAGPASPVDPANPADPIDPAAAPWAAYWATRCDPALPPARARERYAAAFERFAALGRKGGQWLCAAALIETFYVDETGLAPIDGWVPRLEALLPADDDGWPSPELEAQVMACGLAITLRDQTHPLLARWAARGAVLLRRLRPGAVRTRLATFLLQYQLWRGELGAAALIVDALPALDTTGLLPAEQLTWHESVASFALASGRLARGRAELQAALALQRRHGLHSHACALHAHGAAIEIAVGDADAAEVHLRALQPVVASQPVDDQTQYWHLCAGAALLRGDHAQAVALARTTLANSLEIGGPYRTAAHRLSLGQALLAQGDAAAAWPALDAALAGAETIRAARLACTARLMRSAALARLGDEAAADADLAGAIDQAAREDWLHLSGWWLPEVVAERVARACALGLQPRWLRRWVNARGLASPRPADASWPWPLVVRGYGGLQVRCGDEPLRVSAGTRSAQRPLDLLRALLAHAPAPLPVATAIDWLWPDDGRGDPRKAFDAALARLRRLIAAGGPGGADGARALRLDGGRLDIDRRWAWTDVHALDELAREVDAAPAPGPAAAGLVPLRDWARRLAQIDAGPLMPEVDAAWVLPARDRQRQRLARLAGELADRLLPHDEPTALRLLEQAHTADPCAELLARRLVTLHVGRGRIAEAQRVLDLSTAMLRLAGGTELSAATRRLAAGLGLIR